MGAVIGPRGTKIDEVQRSCGCKVQVEPESSGESRLVTIEGPDVESVTRAVEMLTVVVQDWMRRNGRFAAPTPAPQQQYHQQQQQQLFGGASILPPPNFGYGR